MTSASPITSLPPELLLRVFSYLPYGDLTQAALCCPQWYQLSTDPFLWRDLNLTTLPSETFSNHIVSHTLISRIKQCRAFHVDSPIDLSIGRLCMLLHHLTSSPYLQTLNLIAISNMRSHNFALEKLFTELVAPGLVHVNLSRSAITTAPVVALVARHRATLQTLGLEFTSIGDGALRAIANASNLKKLMIGGCFSLSKAGIRAFLAKRVPKNLEGLEMKWLLDVRIGWLWDLFLAQRKEHGRLVHLDVCGCEKLGKLDLERLELGWSGIRIVHNANGGSNRETEVGIRRWREAFGVGEQVPPLEGRV